MRSRANIINGRWTRKVSCEGPSGVWRTDMFKTVLEDDRLKEEEFICKEGPRVIIPVEELRMVLPLGRDHYFESQIWGPFNIDTNRMEIDGHRVKMRFE